MKNIIVGTAGHVDHGKTCLIKALTGMDCDRLKEEKKRGITIENGFADMICGDYNISVIDVPGHEKFVKNMLMGIGGIDMVLLVIGLDEGVMPQTVEHFRILEMLDIRRGIIVFTKRDMTDDEEWIELVKEDARELVKGTFMEGAPEIDVSAFTGLNIEELKELILDTIDDSLLKDSSGMLFRLPVDRVFTIEGFGTVITGTLMEGSIRAGDDVMVYPDEKILKVRNVQVHNETVDEALAGQRTALNLQGVKKEELERGKVLAKPGSLTPSRFLDLRLELFRDTDRTVLNGSRVHFYSGSSETVAKVNLLDREALTKGESCYCQLKLEEPVALRRNDRFIIRFFSPTDTIGGGKILDASPIRHKKTEESVIEALTIKDTGSEEEVAELLIRESRQAASDIRDISLKLNVSTEHARGILKNLLENKRIIKVKEDSFIHESFLLRAEEAAKSILTEYHSLNRMSPGLIKAEFRSRLGAALKTEDKKLVEEIVRILYERKVIKEKDNRVSLFGFSVEMSPEEKNTRERLLKRYRDAAYEMPTVEEALSSEKDKRNAQHMLDTMAEEGLIVRLDHQFYIERECFDRAVEGLKKHIEEKGNITLAEFRDMLGTSRKYAMAILDHTDSMKLTVKTGDCRVLL